jgi:hypothetical protein
MRESRTYGSVRGAPSNERPYRDTGVSSLRCLADRQHPFQRRYIDCAGAWPDLSSWLSAPAPASCARYGRFCRGSLRHTGSRCSPWSGCHGCPREYGCWNVEAQRLGNPEVEGHHHR